MSDLTEQEHPLTFLLRHVDQALIAIHTATDRRAVDTAEAQSEGCITALGKLGLVPGEVIAQQQSRLALEAHTRRNKLLSIELSRIEFADQAFLRAIEEITADITRGLLPVWIGDFDDLIHFVGHRDSYGGLYQDGVQAKGLEILHDVQAYNELCQLHRTRVHLWLRNRLGAIPGARFRGDFPAKLAASSVI